MAEDVEARLEDLRRRYPGGLHAGEGPDDLLADPAVGELVTADRVPALLAVLDRPDLAEVAVLVLSRFASEEVYEAVLDRLAAADADRVTAFESGLWRFPVGEDRIAHDLMRVATSAGNPSLLLLLQRPAARHVRDELRAVIERPEPSWARPAIHAARYAFDRGDADLLERLARWTAVPEVAAFADLLLLQLGERPVLDGLRSGLLAQDEELRRTVAYELSRFVPVDAFERTGYRPERPSPDAADGLVAEASAAR